METEEPGQIIHLNGASSSGKTTIARALQAQLEEPYFYAPADMFLDAYPDRFWESSRDDVRILHRRTVRAFYRSVRALAETGHNVIVDDVVDLPWMMAEWRADLASLDVLWVGVHCDADELDRRERDRGARAPGLARNQLPRVHAHGPYDIEVDTSKMDARACAERIAHALGMER